MAKLTFLLSVGQIIIDNKGIEKELGIPVVLCAARSGQGIKEIKDEVYNVTSGRTKPKPKTVIYNEHIEEKVKAIQPIIEKNISGINSRWLALRIIDGDKKLMNSIFNNVDKKLLEEIMDIAKSSVTNDEKKNIRDAISEQIYIKAEELRDKYVKEDKVKINKDRVIDNYITSKIIGIPLMLLILAAVFWITITGANIPSEIIANFLFSIEDKLTLWFNSMNAPVWLHGVLILGLYRTLAWVISVMLPPMAIFFPIFTILEDLGYLPRVAFNLDHLFKKACAYGKQCLTMCMGFGCNAAGIISCRIIESPRERLIAILTNNFVPCNGRFPTLIAIATVFLVAKGGNEFSFLPALSITGLVVNRY